MDQNLLMGIEEYNKTWHETPYVFSLNSNGQFLFYFGCDHTQNPNDKQFKEIKIFWHEFLSKTNKQSCIVFIESSQLPAITGNENEIIKKFGERGFIVWLAEKEKIPFYYPELQINEEAEMLSKKFPKKLIIYFYFIRSVNSWIRNKQSGDFQKILRQAASACQQRISWQDVSYSVEDLQKVHEEIFKAPLSLANRETIERASAPIYHDSIINDIARESSYIRNITVLEKIEKFWKIGKNLFILYGASHAVMQEKAIRNLVK